MKKFYCVALYILLLLLTGPSMAASCPPAQEVPTPEMIQKGMSNARDHGFLWRISKDGHVSYLYGTIHLAKFDWMFPGKQVMQAIRATDTIALELDMLDKNVQTDLAKGKAKLNSKALPAALDKRMRKQAELNCISYDSIASLTPEFQVVALSMMEGRKVGLESGYAIDAVLAGIGHKAKKNMVSLESPELQLNALQMHDTSETLTFVESSLDEMETDRSLKMLNSIAKYWDESNFTEMERFNEWCECLNTEIERVMMKRLLDDRNPEMALKIDALHKSGKQVFAAVGSLHMFGPLGLPTLMAQRGYRVEKLIFE
jgi:hypothetical protein